MADRGKLETLRLRDACARNAELRARLEASLDEVPRQYGLVPGEGATPAAVAKAVLGGEMTEAELGVVVGGIEVSSWSWG